MTKRNKYLLIEGENIPCVYELSWDSNTPAIIVKIHKDIANDCLVPEDAPLASYFMNEFGFSSFEKSLKDGDFGFNGSFKKVDFMNDFYIFKVAIPVVKKQSDEICPGCEGAKKDTFGSGKCFRCNGTGKKILVDWNPMYAISASFTLLFNLIDLRFSESDEILSPLPQLITLSTRTEREQHGGSLGGTYSIPLAKFLSSFEPNTKITEMVEAMITAYGKMFGTDDGYSKHSFRATVDYENGWLNVSCPGDACGLNPSEHTGPKPGRGYKFSCHNVDSPMQQITLLSGLAALCDMARKEIKVY